MAKIIVVSNSKGGTGKSTMCMQFANYLTSMGKKVAVLDADEGQTIVDLRNSEQKQHPETPLLWKVWNAADNAQAFVDRAMGMDDTYVIVDCPGSLNKNLLPFFKAADAIVVPFRYDDVVIMRTMKFVKVLKLAEIHAKMLFLPNCIDVRVKNPNEEAIKEMFRNAGGIILPRVKQGVAIQRVSTLRPIDEYQRKAIEFTIDGILNVVG